MSNTHPIGSYKYQENNKPRTIKKVSKLDPYLVSFTDGEGSDQVRVVFRVPGSSSFFVVQERIQGNFVVTQANNWFNKELAKSLDKDVESI